MSNKFDYEKNKVARVIYTYIADIIKITKYIYVC